LFILETNVILLGADRDYVKGLSRFKKVHIRVSLKAGTTEDFTRNFAYARHRASTSFPGSSLNWSRGFTCFLRAEGDTVLVSLNDSQIIMEKKKGRS